MSADNWAICPKCKEKNVTLREDYEIGMDEFGTLSIDYSAYCKECKFKYKYNYIISIPMEDKKEIV